MMNKVYRFSKICMIAQVLMGVDLVLMLAVINIRGDEVIKLIVINACYVVAAFFILSPLITVASKFTLSEDSLKYSNPVLRINKSLAFNDIDKIKMGVGWGSFVFVLVDRAGKRLNLNYFTSGYRSIVESVISKCGSSADIDSRIAGCLNSDAKMPYVLLSLSAIIFILMMI